MLFFEKEDFVFTVFVDKRAFVWYTEYIEKPHRLEEVYMQNKATFEEARLTLIRFDAEDILTVSSPYVDENGNIVLPPQPFD